jgi:hypothetical protein
MEMQRHVILVTDYPTVMRGWSDVEKVTSPQFVYLSIFESAGCNPRHDHPQMLDLAEVSA